MRWDHRVACGCPKPCRGWSGHASVFVDESVAACRSDDSKLLLPVRSISDHPSPPTLQTSQPARCRRGKAAAMAPSRARVLVGERWSVVLSAQVCEFVAKHDDLEVLRVSRAQSQACQRGEEPVQNATHATPGSGASHPFSAPRPSSATHAGCSASCLVSAHDRIFGHPQVPAGCDRGGPALPPRTRPAAGAGSSVALEWATTAAQASARSWACHCCYRMDGWLDGILEVITTD